MPFLGFGESEGLAVRADAGLRVLPANGLVSVGVACKGIAGEGGHPVVGDGDVLPGTVVEGFRVGAFVVDGVGLCEVVEIFRAAAPVFSGARCVSKSELPAALKFCYGLCP